MVGDRECHIGGYFLLIYEALARQLRAEATWTSVNGTELKLAIPDHATVSR